MKPNTTFSIPLSKQPTMRTLWIPDDNATVMPPAMPIGHVVELHPQATGGVRGVVVQSYAKYCIVEVTQVNTHHPELLWEGERVVLCRRRDYPDRE